MRLSKLFRGKLISQIYIFIIFIPVLSFTQHLLNGPNDIVFDEKNNRYLVANWAGNNIVAINLDSSQYYFKNNITHAHGMEIRDSVLYVASYHNLLLIDLSTEVTIQNIFVPGSEYLGHITLDSSHYVYITDWSIRRLFRININDQTSTILHMKKIIID